MGAPSQEMSGPPQRKCRKQAQKLRNNRILLRMMAGIRAASLRREPIISCEALLLWHGNRPAHTALPGSAQLEQEAGEEIEQDEKKHRPAQTTTAHDSAAAEPAAMDTKQDTSKRKERTSLRNPKHYETFKALNEQESVAAHYTQVGQQAPTDFDDFFKLAGKKSCWANHLLVTATAERTGVPIMIWNRCSMKVDSDLYKMSKAEQAKAGKPKTERVSHRGVAAPKFQDNFVVSQCGYDGITLILKDYHYTCLLPPQKRTPPPRMSHQQLHGSHQTAAAVASEWLRIPSSPAAARQVLGGLTRIAVRKYTSFGVHPAGKHLGNGPGILSNINYLSVYMGIQRFGYASVMLLSTSCWSVHMGVSR